MSNLSKIKPKLRTQGRVTGNFGRNKVEGKRSGLELSSTTLSKDNLKIPRPEEVYSRLQQAYIKTSDLVMKEFLFKEIQKIDLKRISPVLPKQPPRSEFWDEVKRVR